ncbi:SURF1 family protein [Denitromonas iodatirespirans]|nr:SURF1 family protein [Denitromonas iodatirespirans]
MRVKDVVPYLVGVLVCVLTVQLGLWQTRRAEEKLALGERMAAEAEAPMTVLAAAPEEWQAVRLTGHWLTAGSIYLDNRVHHGQPGYQLLTPLQTEDGRRVLVKRGWLAAGRDRTVLPSVRTPEGEVFVSGRVRRPEAKPYSLADTPSEGARWQYLDLAAYRAQTGIAVADVVVEQTDPSSDGLIRDWPRPDLGVDRHRGYAVQWFGLAALSAGLCGWFGWRRWRHDGSSQDDA